MYLCCLNFNVDLTSLNTVLFTLLEPASIEASDINVHSTYLTWNSQEAQQEIEQTVKLIYVLKIVPASSKIPSQSFQLHESFYVFAAPDDAPPCEVYNFSVTTTYVGAGAGCSVLSPVLSKMLPSLPDISGLESSLKHLIKRESIDSDGITLNVFFKVRYYFMS